MNELQVFENAEFGSVRTLVIDNEPYFVGKDVANILGYQNGSRDINRHVDEDDRCKSMVFDGNQKKETIVINESGLYSLILSSKLPAAKKFKRWVTAEVLPSIRARVYPLQLCRERDFFMGTCSITNLIAKRYQVNDHRFNLGSFGL